MKQSMWMHALAFILLSWMTQSKADVHNLNQLREDVHQYMTQAVEEMGTDSDVEISVGRLDSRLRLNACSAPVDIELSTGRLSDARVTVTAKCPTQPWQVRMPVAIKRFANTIVSQNIIKRGDIISLNDITMMRVDVSRLNRYFDEPKEVIGMQAKTTIRQGKLIKPNMVKQPQLVKRGERVKINMTTPGINIQTIGIAMNNGVKNQTITIKNLKSNRLIEATVTGPNTVSVNL